MNAVIYARYSSHGQTEQSIEGQLHDNYAWAEQQGITVIGEYIDRALTGTKDQRPDFQRMIADAAKRQFELVIVWKLDRFARNRYDSAIYKARLKKYGVKVLSVKENITDSPEGIILEGLLESMAEYYSANLAQNVLRGKRETSAKGNWNGGRVPLGYKAVDGKLVADDKTAPFVQYLFRRYAEGASKADVIRELNEKGLRNRNGKPITYSSIRTVISNTLYIGQAMYDGEVVEGLAERLIDDDLYYKVQAQIQANARAPGTYKARVDYLLRGKAFCGHCGFPMVGQPGQSRNGVQFYYYACSGRKRKKAVCKKKYENKDFIEKYVVEQTVQYVLTQERIAYISKAVVEEYRKEFSETQVSDYQKSLDQISGELERLVDALIDSPKSARASIYARMESLEAQKAEIETCLARLKVASEIQLTESEVSSWMKQFCSGDPSNEDFRRRIIDVFINSIYLYDNRIVIFYNIRGGKQVSYMDLVNSSALPADGECSDLVRYAPAKGNKSEPRYVFVNGVIGCVFIRKPDELPKSKHKPL